MVCSRLFSLNSLNVWVNSSNLLSTSKNASSLCEANMIDFILWEYYGTCSNSLKNIYGFPSSSSSPEYISIICRSSYEGIILLIDSKIKGSIYLPSHSVIAFLIAPFGILSFIKMISTFLHLSGPKIFTGSFFTTFYEIAKDLPFD